MSQECSPDGSPLANRLMSVLASYLGWLIAAPNRVAALHGFDLVGNVDAAHLTVLIHRGAFDACDARFLVSRFAQVASRDVLVARCSPSLLDDDWRFSFELALYSHRRIEWCEDLVLWIGSDDAFWLVTSPRLDTVKQSSFPLGRFNLHAQPAPWRDTQDYLRGFEAAQRFQLKAMAV